MSFTKLFLVKYKNLQFRNISFDFYEACSYESIILDTILASSLFSYIKYRVHHGRDFMSENIRNLNGKCKSYKNCHVMFQTYEQHY